MCRSLNSLTRKLEYEPAKHIVKLAIFGILSGTRPVLGIYNERYSPYIYVFSQAECPYNDMIRSPTHIAPPRLYANTQGEGMNKTIGGSNCTRQEGKPL